jgi:hypothetical protein
VVIAPSLVARVLLFCSHKRLSLTDLHPLVATQMCVATAACDQELLTFRISYQIGFSPVTQR